MSKTLKKDILEKKWVFSSSYVTKSNIFAITRTRWNEVVAEDLILFSVEQKNGKLNSFVCTDSFHTYSLSDLLQSIRMMYLHHEGGRGSDCKTILAITAIKKFLENI